jgi:hypothetical protein
MGSDSPGTNLADYHPRFQGKSEDEGFQGWFGQRFLENQYCKLPSMVPGEAGGREFQGGFGL